MFAFELVGMWLTLFVGSISVAGVVSLWVRCGLD